MPQQAAAAPAGGQEEEEGEEPGQVPAMPDQARVAREMNRLANAAALQVGARAWEAWGGVGPEGEVRSGV